MFALLLCYTRAWNITSYQMETKDIIVSANVWSPLFVCIFSTFKIVWEIQVYLWYLSCKSLVIFVSNYFFTDWLTDCLFDCVMRIAPGSIWCQVIRMARCLSGTWRLPQFRSSILILFFPQLQHSSHMTMTLSMDSGVFTRCCLNVQ